MADTEDEYEGAVNDQLVLISGMSATGKSAALRNLKNQKGVMYLNCESGKRLPFKNDFQTFVITDPYQVYEAFDHALNNPKFHTIVVDTVTFLMDMFESIYIIGAADTMAGWAAYAQFFKRLMQHHVASSDKNVIILGHTRSDLDEAKMENQVAVPIKGALKNNGIESYFSTVVSTKKVSIKELKDYQNDMLHISEDDELVGYKHVFQTRLTKQTIGERIRAPMGMFSKAETFIDNDAQLLLEHLRDYYGSAEAA